MCALKRFYLLTYLLITYNPNLQQQLLTPIVTCSPNPGPDH